ncbi:MAG: methionyl-tRNA formyltransferase [Chlamydiales bacterium]
MNLRIIFFGTPPFAATILDYLLKKKVQVIAVVSRPDKPKGRSSQPQPTAVKSLALANELPIYQPAKVSDPEFVAFLKTLQADLFVVAAFAEILKENVLETPPYGCINVHASVLPKYRGAAPIQRCIMAGEKESGVTIMKMARELDAGAILSIVRTAITEEMTAGELSQILADLGAKALYEVLCDLEKGSLTPIEQDSSQMTYAKKLKPEEGFIDWNHACEPIHNQIRGVTPKPGAWCWIWVRGKRKRLLIKRAVREISLKGAPAEILSTSKNPGKLIIGCAKGAIRLLEIQLEGKQPMAVDHFLRGIAIDHIRFDQD